MSNAAKNAEIATLTAAMIAAGMSAKDAAIAAAAAVGATAAGPTPKAAKARTDFRPDVERRARSYTDPKNGGTVVRLREDAPVVFAPESDADHGRVYGLDAKAHAAGLTPTIRVLDYNARKVWTAKGTFTVGDIHALAAAAETLIAAASAKGAAVSTPTTDPDAEVHAAAASDAPKAALLRLAKARGVTVDGRWGKDRIRDALLAG